SNVDAPGRLARLARGEEGARASTRFVRTSTRIETTAPRPRLGCRRPAFGNLLRDTSVRTAAPFDPARLWYGSFEQTCGRSRIRRHTRSPRQPATPGGAASPCPHYTPGTRARRTLVW